MQKYACCTPSIYEFCNVPIRARLIILYPDLFFFSFFGQHCRLIRIFTVEFKAVSIVTSWNAFVVCSQFHLLHHHHHHHRTKKNWEPVRTRKRVLRRVIRDLSCGQYGSLAILESGSLLEVKASIDDYLKMVIYEKVFFRLTYVDTSQWLFLFDFMYMIFIIHSI